MTFECVARPACPSCGAEWNDEMVALFDLALGLGCACCNPFGPDQLPDIVCHACQKVLYTASPSRPAIEGSDPQKESPQSPGG